MLRNRLLPGLDSILLGFQSGFRPGRSAVEQIAEIRSIIDSCRTRQRAASIVFVDFRKAFDSVSRSSIPLLLSAYGVPPLLVKATMELYTGSSAFIRTSDGPTEAFPTSSGVLQGDTLSLLLFVLVLDYVLRRSLREEDSYLLAPRRCSRSPSVQGRYSGKTSTHTPLRGGRQSWFGNKREKDQDATYRFRQRPIFAPAKRRDDSQLRRLHLSWK